MVYGLRHSPRWWSDERDGRLRKLTFIFGSDSFHLQQNDADSQVWMITKTPLGGRVGKPPDSSGGAEEQLGLLCVYVDDPAGPRKRCRD